MRALRFVPGHGQGMLEEALGLAADVVLFHREDRAPGSEADAVAERVEATLGSPGRGVRRALPGA